MLCRVPPKFFKEDKASRKTQRLCMGDMMTLASPLRVGTRLKQGDVIVNAWFRDNEIRGWQTGALRGYSYKHMADIPVILRRQEQYPH
jgi:hypothetical protein